MVWWRGDWLAKKEGDEGGKAESWDSLLYNNYTVTNYLIWQTNKPLKS